MKNFTKEKILKSPLLDLPVFCMNMKNTAQIAAELEYLSKRAGMIAAYLNERHGHGCGDQGHEKAIKEMNRVGKTIWMKAFGYNGFLPVSF